MPRISPDVKSGFFWVIGIAAGLYVAGLIVRRLP